AGPPPGLVGVADGDLHVHQPRLEGGDDVGDVAGERLALGVGDVVEAGQVAQAVVGDGGRDLGQAVEEALGRPAGVEQVFEVAADGVLDLGQAVALAGGGAGRLRVDEPVEDGGHQALE